jgi:hypothetical protein
VPAQKIPAIRFRQWIRDWDELKFEASEHRRRPSPNIYLFSMPADQLRALSGVFHRTRDEGIGIGIQRGHDRGRSDQIRDFVRFGYPYSEMSAARRQSFDSEDLRKPGWLPTAIVVNILTAEDERRGRQVAPADLLRVRTSDADASATIQLPDNFADAGWSARQLPPLEIIDGQHRLYAFGGEEIPGTFDLPVVAFLGLDIGWQAYLFWSINVSPKKINPSHAFDLYPLLRSQDWLEKFGEANVYREARAQELAEILFRHPLSPWLNRINMLGEKGVRGVSQAAWIRSLSSTLLAAGRGRGTKGLFGCDIDPINGPLPWTRPQQAAFLIDLWDKCRKAVRESNADWTRYLRTADTRQSILQIEEGGDPAFAGPRTMLNQEQGIRGLLSVANDIFFGAASDLNLAKWEAEEEVGASTGDDEISKALDTLQGMAFANFSRILMESLATYDWRSADAPGLNDDEKLKRRAF